MASSSLFCNGKDVVEAVTLKLGSEEEPSRRCSEYLGSYIDKKACQLSLLLSSVGIYTGKQDTSTH